MGHGVSSRLSSWVMAWTELRLAVSGNIQNLNQFTGSSFKIKYFGEFCGQKIFSKALWEKPKIDVKSEALKFSLSGLRVEYSELYQVVNFWCYNEKYLLHICVLESCA